MANIPPFYRTPSPALNPDSQRQSIISSSAASFQTARTAPLAGASQNSLSASSRSSSVHTLGPMAAENGTAIHALSLPGGSNLVAQEVHIVKVSGDTVQVGSGPISDSFIQKVGQSMADVVPGSHVELEHKTSTSHVGPPPPSPPASVEHRETESTEESLPHVPPKIISYKSEPWFRPITFDDNARERQASTGSRDVRFASQAGPSHEPSVRSVDTKGSLSTRASGSTARPPRISATSDDTTQSTDTPYTDASVSLLSKSATHLSADGHLQPPPLIIHRPTRRNTTGSSPTTMGPSSAHRQGLQPWSFDDSDIGELASDIQLQAEQIRRERMSKRAKQQQEAEALLTGTSMTRGPSSTKEETQNNVLVGNLIGEDHVNYVLMYNMLTGIRIGVSRCQAKIKRTLKDEDFSARHKFSFDIVGNELTPSAKYDFKFKDYAPWVFRELREDYFHLDPADYLLSLTAKYILSELGSPGKSGSFFYFSRDYRFIIKTIRHSEHKFLLSILKDYHSHVKNNPHTLLSRFYGLHRVKLPRGRKIHFVIMNNLFPPHKDIHESFDLKGSTVGREYPEEKAAQNPRAVLKDLNWINRGNMLELGPEKRALLTEQLRRDSEFLKKIHVMDYSLLVGIHNMQRGNRDNVRKNTLKVFSPDVPLIRRKNTQLKGGRSPEAIAMRRAMRESDPKRLGKGTIRLPEEDTGDRQHFLFYQDEGGLRATDEANEPMNTLYYLGVIDILTPYSVVKKLEHFWKGMKSDRHKISPVPPSEYTDRFFSFMKAIMRGGGGGAPFKSE